MLPDSTFQLLRSLLADSRNLNLCYFDNLEPGIDLSAMDLGIRAQTQGSSEFYESLRQIACQLSFGTILILRDQLHLTTILLRSDPDRGGLYTIGPFRSFPCEEDEYVQILRQNSIQSIGPETLRMIFQPVPCNILHTEGLAVAKNILLSAYAIENPPVEEYSMEHIDLKLSSFVPVEDVNLRAKQVEKTYQFEEKLMEAISAGDEARAMECVQYFMRSNMDKQAPYPFPTYLQSHRSLMYATNTLFRKAAQSTGIHPLFLDEISRRFAQKLSICATHDQVNAVYLEMIHDYCQLSREQKTSGYGANVQKIMHYVQLNFREDLTPALVAEAVHFSPNYVSRRFREETGMPLMSYVTQCRMRAAGKLLEQTSMTVREIANFVGIPDWNYFTKLFKKETGVTPSRYRRIHNRELVEEEDS